MTELLEQAIAKLKTRFSFCWGRRSALAEPLPKENREAPPTIRQQNEIAAMILEEIKRLEQKTQSIETKTDRS